MEPLDKYKELPLDFTGFVKAIGEMENDPVALSLAEDLKNMEGKCTFCSGNYHARETCPALEKAIDLLVAEPEALKFLTKQKKLEKSKEKKMKYSP